MGAVTSIFFRSVKSCLCFLLTAGLWTASAFGAEDFKERNRLPEQVLEALRTPGRAVLYSLEPGEKLKPNEKGFHGFAVLGQTMLDVVQRTQVVSAFEDAVKGWDGDIGMCFNPRHGLRVSLGNDIYDFVLCYECHQLYLYKGEKLLVRLGAAGSPKVLNDLLTAAQVKLAYTEPVPSPEVLEQRGRQIRENEARWKAATPASLQPFGLEDFNDPFAPPETAEKWKQQMREALAGQYPQVSEQIVALFAWYGSGAGPWNTIPIAGYEDTPKMLLKAYLPPDLIAAALRNDLSGAQLEGAARFFSGGNLPKEYPLPADLKKKLLEHCMGTRKEDEGRKRQAQHVFGP